MDQLEEGCFVTGLFLDFSKAFDCLNHDRLLQKLRTLGIRGTELKWFESYLKDRKQLVEISHTSNNTIQKTHSRTLEVKRGVPQGSVLGPALFLLLTNDMPDQLQGTCKTIMYADDTVLTISDKTIETLERNTSTYLNLTKQYCSNNDLVLNENKTVQIAFKTKNKQTQQNALPQLDIKETTKYLGIIIDAKMTWKPHIDQLCRRLSSGTYVIRRILQVGGLDTAKVAYFALFESHLRYGIVAWGGTSNANLERVLIQQKRAIRCLVGLHYQESCRESFKQLKILTVVSLYIRETILHAITSRQQRHQEIHTYNTRHASNFTLPPHHLSLFEKKPSYKGAMYYNRLPELLKNETPQHFKNKLTTWLQERPYYTENEFLNHCIV
uniref:Reverse transcriptase domain-containing protein n=2 Tax=Graphocephala atropunctata TaxID=36148 RepID=A0A1B6LK65_9HEMI